MNRRRQLSRNSRMLCNDFYVRELCKVSTVVNSSIGFTQQPIRRAHSLFLNFSKKLVLRQQQLLLLTDVLLTTKKLFVSSLLILTILAFLLYLSTMKRITTREALCYVVLSLLGLLTGSMATAAHQDTRGNAALLVPQASSSSPSPILLPVFGIPRGGASSSKAVSSRSKKKKGSRLNLKERMSDLKSTVEKFTDRTYFSRDLMPQSAEDSEWAAFMKGWLLIALPIPLPLVFVVLILDSTMLSFSMWDESIKRKYIIGLYHGALVFSVLLRELDDKVDFVSRPRLSLIHI